MKHYIIEAIGTFFLTIAIGLTADAAAIGFMFMAMIYMGEHGHNGYFNPAITTTLWLQGLVERRYLVGYIVAQCIGAITAGALIYLISENWLIMRIPPEISVFVGTIPELLMTFVLCATALMVASTARLKIAGIVGVILGFTLTALSYLGGLFNPAVGIASFIYSLCAGDMTSAFNNSLVHVVAPFIGAFLAFYYFYFLHEDLHDTHHVN